MSVGGGDDRESAAGGKSIEAGDGGNEALGAWNVKGTGGHQEIELRIDIEEDGNRITQHKNPADVGQTIVFRGLSLPRQTNHS
jgi:hypothetical protein